MNPEFAISYKEGLPEQYARFFKLDQFFREIGSLRDSVSYQKAYDMAWIGLCMLWDRKLHDDQIKSLRADLRANRGNDDQKRIGQYWEGLYSGSVYPKFRQVREEFGGMTTDINSLWYDTNAWATLSLLDIDPERIYFSYAKTLQKLICCRKQSIEPIFAQYDYAKRGITVRFIDDEGDPQVTRFRRILAKTEPYYAAEKEFSKIVTVQEERLFGPKKETAGLLWRCALFLRTSKIKHRTCKELRDPLLELLVKEEYKKARLYLEELLSKYPDALPEFAVKELDIEPELWGKIIEEEKEERKNRKQNQRLDGLQKLEPYLDRTLISSDCESLIVRVWGKGLRDEYSVSKASPKIREFLGAGGNNMGAKNVLALIELFNLKPAQNSDFQQA